MMFPFVLSSVVHVTPTGLLNAMYNLFSSSSGSNLCPLTVTLSFGFTTSPITAFRPLITTVPFSMNLSASLLEQIPLSAIN